MAGRVVVTRIYTILRTSPVSLFVLLPRCSFCSDVCHGKDSTDKGHNGIILRGILYTFDMDPQRS